MCASNDQLWKNFTELAGGDELQLTQKKKCIIQKQLQKAE